MRGLLVFLVSTAVMFAPVTYAADAANLQNTVERYDPGKTASDLSEPTLETDPIPKTEVIDVKGKTPAPPSDSATANIKFLVKKIILIGNTVISTVELEKLYVDKLNTEVSLVDLQAIAQAITTYYRNRGYILSQAIIPPQAIDSEGMVKIKIIEGYINKVSVIGCRNNNVYAAVKDYGEHIARHSPLRLADLERFSFLANDIPGAKVRAVLTRSTEHTGAADLTFVVQEQAFGGYAAYNNYNTDVLGNQQLIGNIKANNLLYASETAINGIMSRNSNRMRYVSFSHKQQLNSDGLGGSFSISNTHTTPDMGTIGLGGLDIPGKAFIATLNLNYSWIRSYKQNLFVGGGFKLLNSTTEFGEQTLFKDNVRSINAYLTYDYMQSLYTNNSITATVVQGLKIFDAQGNPPSRIGEDLTFTKLELFGTSTHRFANRFSSLLAVKAQYAFDTLPSSETFSYGGIPFGYGYAPAEFTGDRGIAGLAELRYQAWSIARVKLLSQIFAFIDAGCVWNLNDIQPTTEAGASTGLGTRMNMMQHVNVDFIVGVPLNQASIEGTPNYVRVLFNVKVYA